MGFYDFGWVMRLFGTAVGAGILFLPIKTGVSGIYPVFFMMIIALPMVYFSHWGLCRYCFGHKGDISDVSREYYGAKVGFFITALYFFAFLPACVMYGVGITNTIISFAQNQLGMMDISRALVVFTLISFLMLVMVLKEDLVIRVCEALVYPLCVILLVFSLYLIQFWDFGVFSVEFSWSDFLLTCFFALPILAFAFEHTPAVSTFASSMRRRYGEDKGIEKAKKVLFLNSILLLFFIMFFVFSSLMCLGSDDLAKAKELNISVVSYFAIKLNNDFIGYSAPVIAFLAIATSFFGHYFGAREGFCGLVDKGCELARKPAPKPKTLSRFCDLLFYVLMLVCSYLNPSIIGIIDNLTGPIIAGILFLLPVIGFYSVPSLKKYRNIWADAFIFIFGAVTICTVGFNVIKDFF